MFERLEQSPREAAGDYAFRCLRHNILTLSLKPGEPLREGKLAELLGVSRTPVREALSCLSRIYLAEVLPQRGSRVALMDPELIEEARRARHVLESMMAERACKLAATADLYELEKNIYMQKFYLKQEKIPPLMELDDQFHFALFRICQSERTYQALGTLRGQYDIARNLCLHKLSSGKAVAEHELIFAALKSRNQEVAVREVQNHIARYASEEEERKMRLEFPDYFKGAPPSASRDPGASVACRRSNTASSRQSV